LRKRGTVNMTSSKPNRHHAAFALWLTCAASAVGEATAVISPVEVTPRSDLNGELTGLAQAQVQDLLGLYQNLHSHPELSLQEEQTARTLAGLLREAGWMVTEKVGGHGVVALLKNGPAPTVLVRADIDALPVTEGTGLPYASKVTVTLPDGTRTGVMHACGHDVHGTVLIGTARTLIRLKERWKETVVLILEPAEEIGKGALMMIEAGLFEKFPRPDCCIALHVDGELPAGQIGHTSGCCNANVDSVNITIHGKGGHGAAPHKTVDPIVTAAYVITALQTIVSRRLDPIEDGVVTVGSIHGGTKHNIIPDQVTMQLTVRSYTDEVRKLLLRSIEQITVDTCKMMECTKPPDVVVNTRDVNTPAAYNDPALTAAAVKIFEGLVGRDNVVQRPPTMGGEDFGRYARTLKVPGFMFRIGSVNPEAYAAVGQAVRLLPALHSSLYAPEAEPTICLGVRALSALTLSLLGR
jgi:amidohydrolase